MTYIRITFGRDRGHVKDFPFPEAQEMLARGQALPVDLEEPNALGYRELPRPETEVHLTEKQPSAVSRQPSARPADATVTTVPLAQPAAQTLPRPADAPVTTAPVPPPHRDGKKKR